MPLTMASTGETKQIKKVGGREEIRRHLENLGFVTGTDVTVVSQLGGNVIVSVIPGSPSAVRWPTGSWFDTGSGSEIDLGRA